MCVFSTFFEKRNEFLFLLRMWWNLWEKKKFLSLFPRGRMKLCSPRKERSLFFFILKTRFSFFRKWNNLFNLPPIKGMCSEMEGMVFVLSIFNKKKKRSSFHRKKERNCCILHNFCLSLLSIRYLFLKKKKKKVTAFPHPQEKWRSSRSEKESSDFLLPRRMKRVHLI